MTVGVQQAGTPVIADSSGASSNFSLGVAPAVGNGIALSYATGVGATGDPSLADNQGNNNGAPGWQKAVSATEAGSGQRAGLYFLKRLGSMTGGTYTLTITHSAGGGFQAFNLIEISSTTGGGIVLDKSNTGNVLTTTPLTAAIDTSGSDASQVAMACMTVDSTTANSGIGTAFSGGTQFVISQDTTVHIGAAADYKVLSATGSLTASYDISASHVAAVVVIASFKEGIPPTAVVLSVSLARYPRYQRRRTFRNTRLITMSSPTTIDLQFPLDENPTDENGLMLEGLRDGVDWNDMQSGGPTDGVRRCFAAVNSGNDSNMCARGGRHVIPNDHEVVSTIYRDPAYTPADSHEVLLLLRWNITANFTRGYEILIPITNGGQIVRWNGVINDFTVLPGVTGPGCPAPVTGDIVRAKIVGSVITVFYTPISTGIEGQVMTVTDSTWAGGNPGAGNFSRTGNTPNRFCHKRVILRAAT